MQKKYSDCLRNKRVALVGPSWHTKHTMQAELIESYDIVVRMNIGLIISEKKQLDIGKRTDILYCSLGAYFFKNNILSKNNIKKAGIKWIIGTGHHRGGFKNEVFAKMDKKVNTLMIDRKRFKHVVSMVETKKKITSGVITIFDLLQYEISELYLTGFTFYNIFFPRKKKKYYYKDYMKGYLSKASAPYAAHDNKKEFYCFKKMCYNDKRIVCDGVLNDIFKNNK